MLNNDSAWSRERQRRSLLSAVVVVAAAAAAAVVAVVVVAAVVVVVVVAAAAVDAACVPWLESQGNRAWIAPQTWSCRVKHLLAQLLRGSNRACECLQCVRVPLECL
jgi:hypothetical protein